MKENFEIYCKFDKNKEDIATTIGKIFFEFVESKNVQKEFLYNSQKENKELK